MNNYTSGVGYSVLQDSYKAGAEAASLACEKIGAKSSPGLALAFCNGKHNFRDCFKGIRSVLNEVPVIGGSCIGIITNDYVGYSSYHVAVAVLDSNIKFEVAAAGKLNSGEEKVGEELADELRSYRNPEEKAILLFYDSVRNPPPPAPELNTSSLLLDGFYRKIGKNPPPVVGAGLISSYNFALGEMFCIDRVCQQESVGALLSGDFNVYTKIMHGCKPISDYHTITRVEGPVVYEIDGKPALKVLDEFLGGSDWQKRTPLLVLTLGVNYSDKYSDYDEDSYLNRLIIAADPEKKGIVLFEADFKKGDQFQFMNRNADLMEESARIGSREAIRYHRSNNLDPFFALYIDCAGRTADFSGALREEAEVIQESIGSEIPLLGFYSGVEIAPMLGKSRGLDWTGVLLILSRKAK